MDTWYVDSNRFHIEIVKEGEVYIDKLGRPKIENFKDKELAWELMKRITAVLWDILIIIKWQ